MKFIRINYDQCRECSCCALACSFAKTGKFCLFKSNIRILKSSRGSDVPLPAVCLQCIDPLCMKACPTEAIYRDEQTGRVLISEELCTGCGICADDCPFSGIWLDNDDSVAHKCDLCDGDPVCVKVCGYNALEYVSGEETSSERRENEARAVFGQPNL